MGCKKCKHYQGEKFGYFFCEIKGRCLPWLEDNCKDYKSKSKYNNVKTVADGIKFDSKKEAARWQELLMLERDGKINKLERQKRFEIIPKTADEKAAFYVADFVYINEHGQKVIEDVKSTITRKNSTYIIKRKLVKHIYPDYVFQEV